MFDLILTYASNIKYDNNDDVESTTNSTSGEMTNNTPSCCGSNSALWVNNINCCKTNGKTISPANSKTSGNDNDNSATDSKTAIDSKTSVQKESKKKLGSNVIFIRDHYGNNCLHLAVHHKLQDMYTHVLKSAEDFLKRDIKTAYAKQLNFGEKSQIINEHYFSKLHDTMKKFLIGAKLQKGHYGYDRIEMPLKMPEDLSQFESWLQRQVQEKISERFLNSLNNDLHTPLTLCAQCPKSSDEDEEKAQKEMLEFLLDRSTSFKWNYGPLTCSTLNLEGFDYPMTVLTQYEPLCPYDKKSADYSKLKKNLSRPRMGVLDWICYRDRPVAAEIPIIDKYINFKWERFSTQRMNTSYYLSLAIALATTVICCFSNASPTLRPQYEGELAVTIIYPIIAAIYLFLFFSELKLIWEYGFDYIGLQGGIRSSALFDKIARLIAMLSFLALCIGKLITTQSGDANKYHYDDTTQSWQPNDRPRENIPMALSAIFAWVYMYYFFMASDKYGSFVITISRIIGKDIPYFLSFYMIVIISYSCALSSLTASGDPLTVLGFRAFIYCFWELIQETVGASGMTTEFVCTSIDNGNDLIPCS